MQYKILLITAYNKPRNINGLYIKAGFEKKGHEVMLFDPVSESDATDRVFEITKEFRPDLILHTKRELPAEIFQELRKFAKVIQWYPDPVITEWLPPYVKSSDIFFTMSEGLIEEFKKYNSRVFWLTQAFEPSFFQINEITPADLKIFSADVAFVGNLGSKPYYLQRRDYLKNIINEGFQLKWWGPKMPKKLSTISLILGKLGSSHGGKFVWGEECKSCKALKNLSCL